VLQAFNGRSPKVDPTAFVSEAAYLIGDIEVSARASIWPAVVLRSDRGKMIVGEGTNIQDGSLCHAEGDMEIGSNTTLGHRVACYAASVGDHCLLGNNCRVGSGAVIGEWCIVGAGAVIPDGAIVPSNTVATGAPAQYAPAEQRHYDLIRSTAESNLRLGQDYKGEKNLE
jgi:carbonic anhydrase/acetyltransferase-like protein (isoleucine patch superfamily)